jgi:hypothetical protein
VSGFVYRGEADGGRIIRTGTSALTRITTAGTTAVLPYIETVDVEPMGPSGDCVFRSVVVAITHGAGYAVTVTPYVDGVELSPQSFSGSGSGKQDLHAWIKQRGARCRVVVELTTRTGDVSFENIVLWHVPIRGFP